MELSILIVISTVRNASSINTEASQLSFIILKIVQFFKSAQILNNW
jgi:hypothetical protein